MRNPVAALFFAATLFLTPFQVFAEKWVEFHRESWSHYSAKLKKKLHSSNYFYYDADSLKRSANGDVTVTIRDISHNDRFYVGKGIPEKEVVYKQILLKCMSRKYEVILEESDESDAPESTGEEVTAGSVYDKLYKRVCRTSQ